MNKETAMATVTFQRRGGCKRGSRSIGSAQAKSQRVSTNRQLASHQRSRRVDDQSKQMRAPKRSRDRQKAEALSRRSAHLVEERTDFARAEGEVCAPDQAQALQRDGSAAKRRPRYYRESTTRSDSSTFQSAANARKHVLKGRDRTLPNQHKM
jgi:hypothetical protein